ncbi:MAG: hypothetical protein ACOYIP_04015 [Coriobacteriales bacterium]|jgi:hypothetical protein
MCTNGVNTNQLEASIIQIDEALGLSRTWTHRLYHLAEHGAQTEVAGRLHDVQRLLDEARAILGEASAAIVDEADSVSVELV